MNDQEFLYVRKEDSKIELHFGNLLNKTIPDLDFIEIICLFIKAFAELTNMRSLGKKVIVSTEYLPISLVECNNRFEIKISYKYPCIFVCANGQMVTYASFEEFQNLIRCLYDILNKEYGNENVNISTFNPSFLTRMLGVDLPYLYDVTFEEKNILDLRAFSKENQDGIPINEHQFYYQLKSNFVELGKNIPTNYLFETNELRMRKVLSDIIEHGYPFKNRYIIIYNDELIIRDGEHRLACLYYLHGNIRIPVMILHFKRNVYAFHLRKKDECN